MSTDGKKQAGPMTSAEIEGIQADRANGMKWEDLAKKYGRSTPSIARALRLGRSAGVAKKPAPAGRNVSDQERRSIIADRKGGMTWRAIMNKYNRVPSVLIRIFEEAGLKGKRSKKRGKPSENRERKKLIAARAALSKSGVDRDPQATNMPANPTKRAMLTDGAFYMVAYERGGDVANGVIKGDPAEAIRKLLDDGAASVKLFRAEPVPWRLDVSIGGAKRRRK